MASPRRMKLGAFLRPCGHHVAAWRHPQAPADAAVNFAHNLELARTAERGLFDLIFHADTVSAQVGADHVLHLMSYTNRIEPFALLAATAAVTSQIGLICTSTTSYDQPYMIQTTFSFEHASGTALRSVGDKDSEIVTAYFAQAAHISRINKGLRRRKEKSDIGFEIDPKTGRWLGKQADEGDPGAGPQRLRQKIVPVVSDRKNVLLVRFPQAWLASLGEEQSVVVTTIQHALARGIEAVFQLEEGEILVEPTPARDRRLALLFYESAEGGAGALSQLLEREDGFRRVATNALDIMHFDKKSIEVAYREGTDRLKEMGDAKCVAGCYRCVLSYFNQMDHELIDRKHPEALRLLLRLAHGEVSAEAGDPAKDGGAAPLPPYDDTPLTVDGHAVRRVWRRARVAALAEGEDPVELEEGLRAKGVHVVWLPADPATRQQAERDLQALLRG